MMLSSLPKGCAVPQPGGDGRKGKGAGRVLPRAAALGGAGSPKARADSGSGTDAGRGGDRRAEGGAAALRAGLPGVRRHRAALRRRGAAGGMLLLLLPLLRALRGPHVPEAERADAQPTPGAVRRCAAGVRAPAVSAAAAGKASPGSCLSLRERLQRGESKERKRWRWGAGPRGRALPGSLAARLRVPRSPRSGRGGLGAGRVRCTSNRVPHWGAQQCVLHLRLQGPGEDIGSVLLPLTPPPFSYRAGDVCAFISNIRFSQSVSSTFPNINSTVHDLRSYLLSIPQQVSFVIDSSNVPLGNTNDSLLNIGPLLGGRIASSIRNNTDEALGSLQSLLGAMETLASTFGTINSTRWRLEKLQGTYDGQLGTLRARIESTLQRCGQPCSTASSNGVAFVANYSTVPGVERQLEALRDVLDSGIEGDLEVISVLEQAPRKVQEQSQDVVTRTQEQLGYIRQEIRSMQDQLPLQNMEERAGNLVNQTGAVLRDSQKTVTDLDSVRWSVCALLCCMVLLVVLCNTCGLLLGPLGHKESTLPTQRGCLSNTGGNFFMAGAGFSFIFSWLLMLLVLLTFFLGGNIYMLVCESWRSQQLFQLVDTPGLIPGFNLSEVLGDESGTVTFSQIYRQCQQDAALWQTLRLDQRVSLDELLNISQYTGEISATFQKLNITLTPISVLNESQRELLLNACRDAQPPNFTHTLQQLDQGITVGSLQELATELEQLVDNAGADVQVDLMADAAELRELDRELKSNFSGPLKTLKENIQLVQSQAAQLEAQTKSTLDKANATEEFLGREMGNIIKKEMWAFLEELLNFFETYITWAKSSLRMDVARCKPIAQSLDNVEAIACDHILDSMNTFWFSLGWCTVFLLPSIILAVRLAKFYRRMDIDDDYRKEAVEIGPAFNLYKIPRPATRH